VNKHKINKMINFFKRKKEKLNNIQIECDDKSIKINGIEISFPIDLNTLIEIFGKPSKIEHNLVWTVVWNDIGVYTDYVTSDNINDIKLLFSKKHKLKIFPNNFFTGNILINKELISIKTFKEKELNKNSIQKLTYKWEDEFYSIVIGKNYNYKEEIPKDKYAIKQLTEEQIEFTDFGFKLSIIQELMYTKELLKPKFDLYEFIEWYDKRQIDIEEEGYEPIPEVTQYFKDLPIPKRLAKEITEIAQDGGNDIYLNLLRFGEGWEEYWDIESIVDAKNFPNLKKVWLCYAKDNVLNEFNEAGIKAKWQ